MNRTDKVALVTGGAGKGMGRSIALTLAREGARVIVNYRTDSAPAQTIVTHIQDQGGQAIAIQADVFTSGGCQHLVTAALEHFGKVDICIINPGGGWHSEPIDQLEPDAALEDLQREVAPLVYLLPLVLPGMYERGWGRVIGIASHLGKPSPAYTYNMSKAARTQALLLAQDQAWRGAVTVNVIAPGPVSEVARLQDAVDLCAHGSSWVNRPDVTPQDIAEGVAFLCSEAGRFVTGCVLGYVFKDA